MKYRQRQNDVMLDDIQDVQDTMSAYEQLVEELGQDGADYVQALTQCVWNANRYNRPYHGRDTMSDATIKAIVRRGQCG